MEEHTRLHIEFPSEGSEPTENLPVLAQPPQMTKDKDRMDLRNLSRYEKVKLAAIQTVVKKGDDVAYLEQYTCMPPPLFIIFISLAQLIVFIVYAVELQDTPYAVTADNGYPRDSPLIYDPRRRWEAWRFISYMFIHIGYVHLILNIVVQLMLGIPLEMVHHWWRVPLVYILGVLGGSLASSVVDPWTTLGGASGGVYALIGAHLANTIMNWQEMNHEWTSKITKIICSATVRLALILLIVVADTGFAIYQRYTPGSSNTSYAAHFGGALSGLLIGIPVLRNLQEKRWERVFLWAAIVSYLLLVLFAVLWNTFWHGFPETEWTPCCGSL